MRRLLLMATGLLALGGLAIGTFDGAPTAPQPISEHPEFADWDVQVHSRDSSSWFALPSIDAQHGSDCSAPPATHPNTSYEGSVFVCNNHMMTALNGEAGYGVIYLAPNRMLDWSGGQATLSFDMSTFRASQRDWVDIWITPYASNLALPLESWLPDLQGEPQGQFIHIRMDGFPGGTGFHVSVNGTEVGGDQWSGYEMYLTPSSTVRTPFELRIDSGHISFGIPSVGLWWANNVAVPVGFTQGVVQIGHHSYTPDKEGAGVPGTWHWDNVSLNPSVPFTILHANQRYTTGGTVTFPAAPAGAKLRFSAVGTVRVNGALVSPQPSRGGPAYEQMASYFVDIPAGSTSATIQLSAMGWYGGPFIAKDFAVWSLATGPQPTATNTVPLTSTATPTNTPVPPTATPTQTPTPIRRTCTLRWGANTLETYGQLTQAECAARGQ